MSSFKSFTKVFSENSNFSKNLDKVFENMGEVFKELEETFHGPIDDSENSIQTDNVNIKVKGKQVVVNGDIESIIFNGKTLSIK